MYLLNVVLNEYPFQICVDITQACRQDEFDDSKLIGKKRYTKIKNKYIQ